MACPDPSHLHAYLDGEVDAIGAAALERHFEECPHCRAQREELEHMRTAIRQVVRPMPVPAALRARGAQSLDRESRAAPARVSHPRALTAPPPRPPPQLSYAAPRPDSTGRSSAGPGSRGPRWPA